MIDLVSPLRRAIRHDPIVDSVVGRDQDGEVKVYATLAKQDVTAPYATLAIVPTEGPTGVYGDDYVWENFDVQVSSWGNDQRTAWQVADVMDDAMLRADYELEPYTLAKIMRSSTAQELTDRDTNMRQVIVLYTIKLGR
jgi:hypothetical protein